MIHYHTIKLLLNPIFARDTLDRIALCDSRLWRNAYPIAQLRSDVIKGGYRGRFSLVNLELEFRLLAVRLSAYAGLK